MALNLGEAFRRLGHDVETWSPLLPDTVPWWRRRLVMRRSLAAHLAGAPPFDCVDCPEVLITRAVRQRSPRLIARSVQPALQYLWHDRPGLDASPRNLVRACLTIVDHVGSAQAALLGWHRADRILCLGSLEEEWMVARFPRWQGKIGHYLNALAPSDQAALAAVRRLRGGRRTAETARFLWIGRLSAHKGVEEMVAFVRARAVLRPAELFTIAGFGPDSPPPGLGAMAVTGRIELIPRFPRAEMPALVARHNAGLFTSRVEGWGLVLNEMLEGGLTVFAAEAGGVRDLRGFFESTLRPFPPPHDWKPPMQAPAEPSAAYLDECSWDGIARRYLESLPVAAQPSLKGGRVEVVHGDRDGRGGCIP